MNRRRLQELTLILLMVLTCSATELNILFIGNSHSYFNDMPQMLDSLAASAGHELQVAVSGVGGSSLSFHYNYQPSLDSIAARDWDLIVLQEHSIIAIIDFWRLNEFYVFASLLHDLIQDQGASTVLFMPQTRANPQGTYCIDLHCSEEFTDYFQMQAALSASYRTLSEMLPALLVPVGDHWSAALQDYSELPLWHADNLHASHEGGYFTACTFYRYLLGESPLGLPYHAGLQPERAELYQALAGQMVAIDPLPPRVSQLALDCFPNPFNSQLTLRFKTLSNEPADLFIYDHLGRVVFAKDDFSAAQNEHTVVWPAHDQKGKPLPSGVYIARITSAWHNASIKLLLLK